MSDKKKGAKPQKYELYFPHKANSRNDPKLLKVLVKHKHAGIGIWWMLVEILREAKDTGFKYPADAIEELAMSLHIDLPSFNSMITTFLKVELLKREDGFIYSPGLIANMEFVKEKSEKARESIRARWNKRNTNVSKSNNGSTSSVIQEKNRIEYPSKEGISIRTDSTDLNRPKPAPEALLRGLVSGWPGLSDSDRQQLNSLADQVHETRREEILEEFSGNDMQKTVKELYKGGILEYLTERTTEKPADE